MTPEEKAIDLINKYWRSIYYDTTPKLEKSINGKANLLLEQSCKAALICVDEILASSDHAGGWDDYWVQVKQEIENYQP